MRNYNYLSLINFKVKPSSSEALLIANLQPQINSRLELNTEYIIN